MAFSLISWIDGSSDCEDGSRLGYWGLIIWSFVIVYLFVGLYVLCEIYFVPILIAISQRLNMSEDVAGATLMAAGSSAPELFTAIIGVLVYPDENPGPSTNCASAAFNMCVIIGCSIFFCGYQALPIRGYPFIRDCLFYAIAVIELYLFWEVITPGMIQWGESLCLVLSWCGYIVVLMYNNRVIRMCVQLMSWMGLTNAEEMMYEQLAPPTSKRKDKETHSLLHSDSDSDAVDTVTPHSVYQSVPTVHLQPTASSNVNDHQSLSVTERAASSSNDQLLGVIADDDDHDHSAFIAMELEEMDAVDPIDHRLHHQLAPSSLRVLKTAPKGLASRHPPPPNMSDADHGRVGVAGSAAEIEVHHDDDHNHGPTHSHSHHHPSGCGKVFDGVLLPFHFAFRWTVPRSDSASTTGKLVTAFCLVLVWLGVLTFVCVDAAEKMGNCLHINEDVMGLTLLAIGSSLPDCFSSVLAAKQGKGEMAVSNALGSNVFDINICIGVSFLTSSIVKGFKAIVVEHDEGFELFIAALFVLLAIFMVAMFCYGLVLNKNIGAGLMAAYAVFLGAFCYLLQFD